LAQAYIQAKHDFTIDETRIANPDLLEWCNSTKELNERWRKRIKAELLAKKLDDTPLPEARTQLVKRYTNVLRFAKQTERPEVLQRYLSSMTHSFDPHSSYMSPQTREDFDISMRLRLQGIGASLSSDDGFTVVREIVPGGAADSDGRLAPGDKIIGVGQKDGDIEDIVEMKLSRVVRLIRGKKGTKVRLQVKAAKTGETHIYELTRQIIELKQSAVTSTIIDAGKRIDGASGRIGVIKMPSFYRDFDAERRGVADFRSSARDVRKALEQFNSDGNVDAVIIDLRTNGGGALKDSVEVSGLFIDKGPVVRVTGFDGSITPHNDPDSGIVWSGPLVVMTSRMSASASEIFAGAITDYRRGLLVGDQTTHGKGTVQNVMAVRTSSPLNFFDRKPPGALKLTIQQFYRVNGASSQERGIPSDIVIPSIIDHMDIGENALENHLPFDKIPAADYDAVALVNPAIVAALAASSSKRIAANSDFAKDLDAIQKFLERKRRKTVSLNEATIRKEIADNKQDDPDKTDSDDKDLPKIPPVFRDDHYSNEVLQITLDYIRQLKQANLVGR
jgi:carboxyl-terminal processing protease